MDDLAAYAVHYVKELKSGDRENAYFRLIEAEHTIAPILIEPFHSEQDPDIRSELVAIVWQHRLPETIEFLAQALDDHSSEVWENALDGLVAIGGKAAIRVLESARRRSEHDAQRGEWIDEAIEQVGQPH